MDQEKPEKLVRENLRIQFLARIHWPTKKVYVLQ